MGKIQSFKDEFAFEQRLAESTDMLGKYPDRVPVIAEKYSRTDLPELEKRKCYWVKFVFFDELEPVLYSLSGGVRARACSHGFLVPRDMSVGHFIHILSGRLHLPPGKALFIFLNDTLPQTSCLMNGIYESYKDDDGFLYMCYSSEKTFGGDSSVV